jgi:hypothetical protein
MPSVFAKLVSGISYFRFLAAPQHQPYIAVQRETTHALEADMAELVVLTLTFAACAIVGLQFAFRSSAATAGTEGVGGHIANVTWPETVTSEKADEAAEGPAWASFPRGF